MKKHFAVPSIFTLLRALFLIATISIVVQASAQQHDNTRKGYAAVNGIKMYYEISGKGEPQLLLHGGLGSTGMFSPLLPALSAGRQVIAVDLYGHGRTALTDRSMSFESMSDDIAALLKQLGYTQVDVLGYSLGGITALRLAIQHPGAVRRLALISAGFARDGFYPEILAMQEQMGAGSAEMLKETPMYQGYAAIAPKPGDFPKLLDRTSELMRKPYNWTSEVKQVKIPVMLVYGDGDMYRPEHIVEFYRLLGGGLQDAGWMREHMPQNRLAILPNLTHYEMLEAPQLAPTVLPFLDGKMQAKP